jgi:hypothetical protein
MLEVGVFEMSGIFQAEAEKTVEGDVSGPDQGDGKRIAVGQRAGLTKARHYGHR